MAHRVTLKMLKQLNGIRNELISKVPTLQV
jgi:hypothetical protein